MGTEADIQIPAAAVDGSTDHPATPGRAEQKDKEKKDREKKDKEKKDKEKKDKEQKKSEKDIQIPAAAVDVTRTVRRYVPDQHQHKEEPLAKPIPAGAIDGSTD